MLGAEWYYYFVSVIPYDSISGKVELRQTVVQGRHGRLRLEFESNESRKERKKVELAGVYITHKQGGAELAGTCNCRPETEKFEPRRDRIARIVLRTLKWISKRSPAIRYTQIQEDQARIQSLTRASCH